MSQTYVTAFGWESALSSPISTSTSATSLLLYNSAHIFKHLDLRHLCSCQCLTVAATEQDGDNRGSAQPDLGWEMAVCIFPYLAKFGRCSFCQS